MSGYQRVVLPTSSLPARGSRPEGDGANSNVGGGGVRRVRKTDRKGREVVSCRTLDEAHARCEAARAFMRAKNGASDTRTTDNPGCPSRPGRRHRRGNLFPRGLSWTSSESGYGRWCPAVAAATVAVTVVAAAADHAAHIRTYTRAKIA